MVPEATNSIAGHGNANEAGDFCDARVKLTINHENTPFCLCNKRNTPRTSTRTTPKELFRKQTARPQAVMSFGGQTPTIIVLKEGRRNRNTLSRGCCTDIP